MNNRIGPVVAVLAVLAAIGFVQAELQEAQRAPAERFVTVSNFPKVQTVDGTVNVGNLPAVQAVTGTVAVSSIPAAPSAKRFQFVGFTTQTYDGDQGGFFGTTVACQLEFPNSRMCTRDEYLDTTTLPDVSNLPNAGWIDSESAISNNTCFGWTDNTGNQSGLQLLLESGFTEGQVCFVLNPFICCAPV